MKKKLVFPMFIGSSKGGMQQIVLDLIEGLSNKGWECLFIGYEGSDLIKYYESKGISTIPIKNPKRMLGYLPFVIKLYHKVLAIGPCVLIVNDIFTHILLSLLPARKNEVFVSHGGNYKSKGSEFAANSGNAARIAKYTFKRVKKFIAVSNSQKTALIVNAGVPRRKVFTVFNGVKRPENYALSYNFHEDTISISIIGYIKRLKNQTLLLDVIKNLINAGLKCKLNIFGAIADEEYDKELNSKIQRLGIENNVEFFGYVGTLANFRGIM